jgi:uncharacterized protein YqeY
METKAELENALKAAMRAHDELQKRTLRSALASIKLAEVEKNAPLDEAAVLAILQKEVKSRHEAIADAQRAKRPDLEAQNQAEIEVLERFLPQPFAPQDLEKLVRQVIAEEGASSPRDMGRVMKALVPRLQGRATGEQASQTVRKVLQEG